MKSRYLRPLAAVLVMCFGYARAQTETPGGAPSDEPEKPAPRLTLPTAYDDHRFFALPVTARGSETRFLTSTGDETLVYSDAVRVLGVPLQTFGGSSVVHMPVLDPDHSIPTPRGARGEMPVVAHRYRRPYLPNGCSGILGQSWFADRVWMLDYPAQTMMLLPIGDLPSVHKRHQIPLRFRDGLGGGRQNYLPRMQVMIDGEQIEVLLNTGASVALDAKVAGQLGDKRPANRSMSFISQSQFDAWRQKNQWRVIENAEQGKGAPMMEVPKLRLGGFEVGPVWFMARSDSYFRNQVSRKLDRRVIGSLGGNALRFFRVTLDLPNAVALIEKP